MIVAVHQPNYFPWIGYFVKIYRSDCLIFLDDVLFSRGSYTNRVRVLCAGKPKWLSVPLKKMSRSTINRTMLAQEDWRAKHKEILKSYYQRSLFFEEVFSLIGTWIDETSNFEHLSDVNIHLIQRISTHLGLHVSWRRSSESRVQFIDATERLVSLSMWASPRDAVYLSGSGGINYQDEEKFLESGVSLKLLNLRPATYPQYRAENHISGLSILDALFNTGWRESMELIRSA